MHVINFQNIHISHTQISLRSSIIKLLNFEIKFNLVECIQKLNISKEFENYHFLQDELFYGMNINNSKPFIKQISSDCFNNSFR